jgi:hypothetical protein
MRFEVIGEGFTSVGSSSYLLTNLNVWGIFSALKTYLIKLIATRAKKKKKQNK